MEEDSIVPNGEALQASERHYQRLFESAPIAIAILDASDSIVEVNAAFAAMVGRSREDLDGRELGAVLALDQESRHAGWRADMDAGSQYRTTSEMVRPDGSRVATRQTTSVVRDTGGRFLYTVCMVEDVTQQTRVDGELRRREEILSTLVDTAPVGIALVRPDDTAERVNPAMERMFGVPASVLDRKPLHAFIDPSESLRGQGVRERFLTGALDFDVRERAFVRPDGVKLRGLVSNSAVRDESGALTHFARVIYDITERRRTERSKDEFLAMASHELRTPVTAIHAALALIGTGGLGTLPPKINAMVSIAAANSERLVTLVGDLIELEGVDLGKIPLDLRICNTLDIAHEASMLLMPLADEFEVELVTDASSEDFTADRSRILQALTNLMSNAIKYAPKGSEVNVSAVRLGDAIQFTVSDRGPGIPPDQSERIFESFQRVDQSDTRPFGGTGLGLAITKAIVERHRGRIWVESRLGEGSAFKFVLPTRHPADGGS